MALLADGLTSSLMSCVYVGQVLHCVLYPRQHYDVPILSIDIVGKGNNVSLAIIDPCPSRMDRSIPAFFCDIVLCALHIAVLHTIAFTAAGSLIMTSCMCASELRPEACVLQV